MDPRLDLARRLMEEHAVASGLLGDAPPRRYLWTDAFAVTNHLGLHRATGESRYLELALRLVDQVHHGLGRHRPDDPRRGWISGLPEPEGERHPTRGGLRIGKPLPERGPGEPFDSELEWERDGQYFHYLTKWMHALHRVGLATGTALFHTWAVELSQAAHAAFFLPSPGAPRRMVWKMSIALDRPQVASMGHHDPLDALLTDLDLATSPLLAGRPAPLEAELAATAPLTSGGRWATDDALGIGGLLFDVYRLARLELGRGVRRPALLETLLEDSAASLEAWSLRRPLELPRERRLAFRELGLSIGLEAISRLWEIAPPELGERLAALRRYSPLAARIEETWAEPAARESAVWRDHADINAVMLATSLEPDGFLAID